MSPRYFQQTTVGGVPLTRELSIGTTSDAATISAQPGAGHTLDKALAWGGERLERAVTWASIRAGRGPVGPMKEIVRAVHRGLSERWVEPRQCRWCDYEWIPEADEITAPPSSHILPSVCEWLVYATSAMPSCPKCGWGQVLFPSDANHIVVPMRSSKKLIKMTRSANKTSRYISVQLLILLGTMFPASQEILTGLGAVDVLHKLSDALSDELHMDPLLASSRRALVSLSDVEVLSLGKELMVNEYNDYRRIPIISKLIKLSSHPDKILLALTTTHRFPSLLFPMVIFRSDVLHTFYRTLFSRLTSSSDPVEVAVIADSLCRFIKFFHIHYYPWLIPIIKAQPDFLEYLPPRLRTVIVNDLPAKYEQEAIKNEEYRGRRVNPWRREIWKYDPHDPEGEPDDGEFFKQAARDDGKLYGQAKIDVVWWDVPVWEICTRRKRRLQEVLARAGREEQGTEEWGQRGRRGRCGSRARAQSISTWPSWMKNQWATEAAEWREYWEKGEFVNFTGWTRKVGMWLQRERVPLMRYYGDRDWQIFWRKLSTQMRSRSVD